MKTVAVTRLQLFKGSETFVTEQARHLKRYEPVLLGKRLFGPSPHGLRFNAPQHRSLGRRLLEDGLCAPNYLRTQLRSEAFSLVHCHFAVDGAVISRALKKVEVPLITTLHGFDVTQTDHDFLRTLRPSLMAYVFTKRNVIERTNRFICVSDFIRRAAIQAGFPEEKLQVHYIGTELPPEDEIARGDRSGRFRLLHVARLVEKKGTMYLLEALHSLVSHHPELHLTVLGDGPLRGDLERYVAEKDLKDHVWFGGQVPYSTVKETMLRSDLFVLPSVTATNGDAEGLGMVLLEAAARGLPIIGTKHGGIPEAVIDGETGLLVRERNSRDLACALESIIGEPSARERLGGAGKQFIKKRFNIVDQTAELETIYDSINQG